MADEHGLRERLQDGLELRRKSGAPRPFVLEMIDFLEVNQDRNIELGGQRIGAPELLAVGGGVILHLAESRAPALMAWVSACNAIGLCDVGARKPGESSRRRRLHGATCSAAARAREQIRFGNARAVEMREVRGGLRPQVEMEIEDRRAPFVRLLAPRGHGRQRDRRGDDTKKVATGQHAENLSSGSGLVRIWS